MENKYEIYELTGNFTLEEVTKDVIENSSYENFKTELSLDVLTKEFSWRIGVSDPYRIWKNCKLTVFKDLLARYISKLRPGLEELMEKDVGSYDLYKEDLIDLESTMISSVVYRDGKEYHVIGNDLEITLSTVKKLATTRGEPISKDIHVDSAEKYAEKIKQHMDPKYVEKYKDGLCIGMLFLCSQLTGNSEQGDPRYFIITCGLKKWNIDQIDDE